MSIFDFGNPKYSKVLPFVLSGSTVVAQGDLLCGNPATGMLVAATAADDTMLPIGFATRDAVGNGIDTIEVQLFEPIWSYSFANDAGSIVFAFTECFVKNAAAVAATGTCPAGLVLAVTPSRVQVRFTPYLTVPAPVGP